MSNLCIWDKIWAETKSNEDFWWWVRRDVDGVRGKKVTTYINKYLGNIKGLNTIEVGSGTGVFSLIFALNGASVTLLDYSQKALSLAHKYFDSYGLLASFLCLDALNLSPDLLGKFDVAMSFGTVEHYQYPERLLIAKAHIDLVKAGGIVIISVPNRLFFPHKILKFCLQRRNKWHLGYEGDFTRQELFQFGNKLGLKNIEIFGSAFTTDIVRYLHIIQGTSFFRKFYHVNHMNVSTRDLASPFDSLLGADIFLMGRKPPLMYSK